MEIITIGFMMIGAVKPVVEFVAFVLIILCCIKYLKQ